MLQKINKGFTLVEVIISISLMVIMMLAVTSLMEGTVQYTSHLKDTAFLQEKIDKALYTIREDLLQVKLIFERGSNFEGALIFNTNAPLVRSGSNTENIVMPDIGGPTDTEVFGIDGTSEVVQGQSNDYSQKTGNFLVFVKKEETAILNINDDDGIDYIIDLYRIIAYFPSFIANDTQFNTGYRSVLIRWQSDVFADFSQVSNVPLEFEDTGEEHRRRVLSALVGSKNVTHLADFRQSSVADAFFEIITNGNGEATGAFNLDTNYSIVENDSRSVVTLPDTISLAMPAITRSGQPLNPAGNKFSTIDDTFPGGFEAQIIQFGDYTTLLRITLVKKNLRNQLVSRTGEIMVRSTFF